MEKPIKEQYGWVETTGFDGEPSGFMIEGGEEAYEEAINLWIFMEQDCTGDNDIDDGVSSAGICDTCSIPIVMNTGDGINEPLDPILYCREMKREILPERFEDRMVECRYYKEITNEV